MKIKTVAILGAGAVGSYVIWGLAGLKDVRLGLIAQGERQERLRKEGYRFKCYCKGRKSGKT